MEAVSARDRKKMITKSNAQSEIDFDIHGVVGVRLINPSLSDAAAVRRQIGPLEKRLVREPDVIVRFVERIPVEDLNYVDLFKSGFDEHGFYMFEGEGGLKSRIAFEQIGAAKCDIECESGIQSVPLLMHILNATALKSGYIALHASAFVESGTGVLVTGWAKGGKSEALLAFAANGAQYVGDEWIWLSADGQRMCGIPEYMTVWDWHLDNLPQLQRRVGLLQRGFFRVVRLLDRVYRSLENGLRQAKVMAWLGRVLGPLKRQLHVRLDPEIIFGKSDERSRRARPDLLFMMVSHAREALEIEPIDGLTVIKQMLASIEYERNILRQNYHGHVFAFPKKRNPFLEKVQEIEEAILFRALAGKPAYVVRHPYPVAFDALYRAMRKFTFTPSQAEDSTGENESVTSRLERTA
jgi:hypothetical protein